MNGVSMFDGIDMYVLDVITQITIVADGMFPEARLPG
jgi:hypothetical protein